MITSVVQATMTPFMDHMAVTLSTVAMVMMSFLGIVELIAVRQVMTQFMEGMAMIIFGLMLLSGRKEMITFGPHIPVVPI